ncbi:MAG: molybdopterin-dependent oxidoreductase [Haloplanus sp.]
MARSERPAPASGSPRITLVGDGERVVGAGDWRDAPWETVTASFRCASGERWTGEWHGVPVEWYLDRAPGGDAATHLRIGSADGHVACVSLADAIRGVLAVGRRDDATLPVEDRPRFIAPGVVGARTVRSVRRLELVILDPDDHVEEYESLNPVG